MTGLSVKDFELIVSVGIFNDSLMNSAVYNFKRYEDASLEYTGLSKHAQDENVGLFSTVISKQDYEDMSTAQTASMSENPFKKVVVISSHTSKQAPNRKEENITPKSASEHIFTVNESQKNSFMKTAEKSSDYAEVDLSKIRIGTKVENKRYGIGRITGFKPGRMLVAFETDQKVFMFPSAFEEGYLKVIE